MINCKNCNLITHGALRSSQELVETRPCVPDQIELEFENVGF